MVEKVISTNIRRYREAKGLSIEKIAVKSGLPIENYIGIESGQTEITFSDLDLISSVLFCKFILGLVQVLGCSAVGRVLS